MTGPEHYLAAERILASIGDAEPEEVVSTPDLAAALIARAQVHATLALASATALAIDPTPEAFAGWDPLLLDDDEPVVDDEDVTVCGAELNPGAGDGITCSLFVRGAEHAKGFHDDGRGNRWAR